MDVQEITSDGALAALRPEWEDLWSRSPAAGPFQHPDWLLAWRQCFCDSPIWVMAVRDAGRLVALAPFFLYQLPGGAGHQLTLFGNGISDRLDILVDPAAQGAAAEILDRMRMRGAFWDRADLRDLPPQSPMLALSRSIDFEASLEPDIPCPILDLGGAGKDLKRRVPAGLLANLRTARRRAERFGELALETVDTLSLAAAFEALQRLHAARWRAKGGHGALADGATAAFHRQVAGRFMRRGWLRLHQLSLDGQVIAISYGFHVRRRAYYYIGGFDPAFAHLSPGALVIEFAVREAVREGAGEFDFLRGQESYKYAWGAKDQAQFRLQLARRDQIGRRGHGVAA